MCWLTGVFGAFFSPSRQMPARYPKHRHDQFTCQTSQIILLTAGSQDAVMHELLTAPLNKQVGSLTS